MLNTPDENIALLLTKVPYEINATTFSLLMHSSLIWKESSPQDQLKMLDCDARKRKTSMIVAMLHDDESQYQRFDNLFILRSSMRKSMRQPREWTLPYVWEGQRDSFMPSPESVKPSIGFCGMNSLWRQPMLSAFSNNEDIETNFIIRDQFWGGNPGSIELIDDFWQNMYQNAFALTPRGAGNFSMRFYQALSAGRIPVVLDTDICLPLENLIKWKECIIVGKTPSDCMEKVMEVWRKEKVQLMQKRCFDIYHNFLAHGNYLNYLWPEIIESSSKNVKTTMPFWKNWQLR